MKKSTLERLSSMIFFIIVCGILAYAYINSIGNSASEDSSVSTPEFDIAEYKSKAQKLMADRENSAGIPLPTPTTKMGKDNPFTVP